MAHTYNNLRRKVEEAVRAYLESAASDQDGTASYYRYMQQSTPGDTYTVPCVIVRATGSRPMADTIDATSGLTNRYVALLVEVRTHASDLGATVAADRHDNLLGSVMDALHSDTLVTDLNAQAIEGVDIEQVDLPVEEADEDGQHIISRLTFDVLAHSKEVG
jgi:hypothetical protein